MSLRLHNTLSHKKEEFAPIIANQVTLYTCGPTVYGEPHLGNWVAFLRWDILVRVLRAHGYKVERVMNITDVGHLTSDADEGEDKISKGARREGITEWEVAERYTNSFLEGMTALNLLPPEHLTKATEHIQIQIELIQKLEDKGYAYVLDEGVYFDTAKFPTYADFAHLDLENLRAGARIEFNSDKRNPSDFVLWRLTPDGEDRNMEWESPWGRGVPGWHIECSAMAMHYLGETIDIHTGGIDHIPVHHTNEIAQSEAASGKKFANYWLHANFLTVDGTKISKSLENDITLDDLSSKNYTPADFRMFMLQSHYTTESNFTWENLGAAHNRLSNWQRLAALRHQFVGNTLIQSVVDAPASILSALDDDLNSPEALRVIDSVLDELEGVALTEASATPFVTFLQSIDDLLGINLLGSTPDINDEQKALLTKRSEVREAKNWDESDALRDELRAQRIGIDDTQFGQRWYWIT